jgi:nitroreductase
MLEPIGPQRFVRGLAAILRGRPQIPPSLSENTMLRAILERRSVRRFTTQPIPDEVFAAILEAGRFAPSTVNLQTWSFIHFTPDAWQERFGRGIPFRAARAVVVVADASRARAVLDLFPASPLVQYTLAVMNASLAAMNMTLAAEALGIASVMLSETGRTGLLDTAYLAERLTLPEGAVALMTIVFGYRRGVRPPMPPRLPLAQVAFAGAYTSPDPAALVAWRDQMIAGYKASRPESSFETQLRVYLAKISQAEDDLRRIVLGTTGPSDQ